MKRISILALILCGCLMSTAWAQQRTRMVGIGKGSILRHRAGHAIPNSAATTRNPNIGKTAALVKTVKFYDLGTYPDGTWAQMTDINDWDVAVGLGDTPDGYDQTLDPPRGYTRPIGRPLFSHSAMQWFDLGTLGGESYINSWETADTACSGISDTWMIVGNTRNG